MLVEGDYNGVLRAGEHYIPLRRDLSNLEDVLRGLADERRREQLVEAAHRDVVASGRYEYPKFVAEVEDTVIGPVRSGASGALWSYAAARVSDRAGWLELWWRLDAVVRLRPWLARAGRFRDRLRAWTIVTARRALPDPILELIRRRRGSRAGSSR